MNDSIFLQVLGEKKEPIVYEDSEWFVLFSNKPLNEGHLLVIPKMISQEFVTTPHIQDGLAIATRMGQLLKSVYDAPRIGMYIKGFSVSNHMHIHVVPLYSSDDTTRSSGELNTITIDEMWRVYEKLSRK